MFTSVIETAGGLTLYSTLISTGTSLLLGLIIALAYMSTGRYSKNMALSLVLLPALVQTVIMMVNGNLGTGVAVMGAFSLVRFRSAPGNSKEICIIFLAMATGLATGTGYITFALGAVVTICGVFVILTKMGFGDTDASCKELKITIPENLDYNNIFDDLFSEYSSKTSLERVRTTNLGSMYELTYDVHLKNSNEEKKLIDGIRCRNGNLTIICGRHKSTGEEL